MSTFKVALLQMTGHETDREMNLETGLRYCRRAGEMGADLALFPEMWNMGYSIAGMEDSGLQEQFPKRAIGPDGDFVRRHRELAAELNMGICVTYLEATGGSPKNTLSIIGRDGELIMTYSKVHTCDFTLWEALCAPGDSFSVAEFNIDSGSSVMLGGMICYDREFPESARILMLKGAEIVLTPNSCWLDELRIDQYKTRAYENAMGMAMTNYAKPKDNGHSVAFGEDGRLIVSGQEGEGILIAEFDLERLRDYRKKTIWGNAFRRPHHYDLLTSMEIDPVFHRANAYGKPFARAKR